VIVLEGVNPEIASTASLNERDYPWVKDTKINDTGMAGGISKDWRD
jgi:hypothetical protein